MNDQTFATSLGNSSPAKFLEILLMTLLLSLQHLLLPHESRISIMQDVSLLLTATRQPPELVTAAAAFPAISGTFPSPCFMQRASPEGGGEEVAPHSCTHPPGGGIGGMCPPAMCTSPEACCLLWAPDLGLLQPLHGRGLGRNGILRRQEQGRQWPHWEG